MDPTLDWANTTDSSTSRLNLWLEPHTKLEGVAMIDHLFNRFDGMYPHRWRSTFQSVLAIENWRQIWAEAFSEKNITLAEIKKGLSVCRERFFWPPSLTEFLSVCRTVFDFEAAFREAVDQIERRLEGQDRWSHPAIYWAAVKIGRFDLRNQSWKTIRLRWTQVLQAELDKRQWPEIPVNREALSAPGKMTSTYEVQRQHIDKLMSMLAKAKKINAKRCCANEVNGSP